MIVSIKKAFPGHAHKVMHAIWGLGMLSLSKSVVVVDAHVNVHDYEEVFFYVGANVDPKRDVVIAEGPLDHLDHAPAQQFVGGKLGIDATAEAAGGRGARVAGGDRHERGDQGARRPPLGGVRDTGDDGACRRGFGTEWLSPRVAAADTSLTARTAQGLNPET